MMGENQCSIRAKRNPDALAGVIGADLKKSASGKIGTSRRTEYAIRAERATALCDAIRETHPDDARQILTAALDDLLAGAPMATFDVIREDARWWAGMASPIELMEYMGAALEALGDKALCRNHRKALFVRLWNSLSREDRRAFRDRIGGAS